jgi:cell division protein FtsB
MGVSAMAQKQTPARRVRLIYRRAPTMLKCMLLGMLLLGTLALIVLRFSLLETKEKAEDLRDQAAVLEQENRELERSISQLGTVQSVTELAGKLLGLVDPDTVIFETE